VDGAKRTFHFKTFFKELPTLQQLNIRRPDIYKKSTCPRCTTEEESDLHPFLCDNSQTTTLQFELVKMLNKECSARAHGNKQHTNIKDIWAKTQIFNNQSNKNNVSDHVTFADIIRGVVTNKMVETATEITNNHKSAKDAITAAINKFWDLKKQIWKARCEEIIAWERTQNINKKNKRTKPNKTKQTIKQKIDTNRLDIFQKNFISLTNIAMIQYLNNIDYFYNFIAANISASGVSTR
jgi:hypothetical protein